MRNAFDLADSLHGDRVRDAFVRLCLPVYLSLKAFVTPVAFGVCAIVENDEGRILLVRHTYQPGWLLPGGGVGRGEPPEDALMRELAEEVGLATREPPKFVRLYSRRAGWVTNVIALYHLRGAKIAFRRNFEISDARFFAIDALPAETPAPVRRRVAEVFAGAKPSSFW